MLNPIDSPPMSQQNGLPASTTHGPESLTAPGFCYVQGPVNTPDEAFLALYGMAGSIVEMPPAVEPEDRRDGTYYLDRKVSYNRGVS